VDSTLSDRSRELRERLAAFMDEYVYPAEAAYARGRTTSLDPHHIPPVVEELKVEARSRGLWNLFLPGVSGLSNVEYAPLAELMGRSPVLAAEACNCSAPDTGNMELLHMFGTPEQQRQWLGPLLDTVGHKGARIEVAAIKAAVPRAVAEIIDRAIQVHGGLGLSGDVPLAQLYAASRALRIADGPDDVHLESVARRELGRHQQA